MFETTTIKPSPTWTHSQKSALQSSNMVHFVQNRLLRSSWAIRPINTLKSQLNHKFTIQNRLYCSFRAEQTFENFPGNPSNKHSQTSAQPQIYNTKQTVLLNSGKILIETPCFQSLHWFSYLNFAKKKKRQNKRINENENELQKTTAFSHVVDVDDIYVSNTPQKWEGGTKGGKKGPKSNFTLNTCVSNLIECRDQLCFAWKKKSKQIVPRTPLSTTLSSISASLKKKKSGKRKRGKILYLTYPCLQSCRSCWSCPWLRYPTKKKRGGGANPKDHCLQFVLDVYDSISLTKEKKRKKQEEKTNCP